MACIIYEVALHIPKANHSIVIYMDEHLFANMKYVVIGSPVSTSYMNIEA